MPVGDRRLEEVGLLVYHYEINTFFDLHTELHFVEGCVPVAWNLGNCCAKPSFPVYEDYTHLYRYSKQRYSGKTLKQTISASFTIGKNLGNRGVFI